MPCTKRDGQITLLAVRFNWGMPQFIYTGDWR